MLKNLLRKKTNDLAFINTPEFRQVPRLRIISIFLSGVFIFFIGFAVYFVYQNIYTSLNQIETLSVIQTHSASQTIDFDTLDKVQKMWDEKYSNVESVSLRNPFTPTSTFKTHN